MTKCLSVWVFMVLTALSVAASAQTKTLFRYQNSAGITVVDSAIPPQYVANGYQIISHSGKVIKNVPPALTPAEAKARADAEALRLKRQQEDYQLRRSYSNTDDIDAAKVRNLQMLESSIVILERNLVVTRRQLKSARTSATNIERSAKVAPEALLQSIASLAQEEVRIEQLLVVRREEAAAMDAKFEADKRRFLELTQSE